MECASKIRFTAFSRADDRTPAKPTYRDKLCTVWPMSSATFVVSPGGDTQINEAFHLRQRRLELAGFRHDLDHLGKSFHVDLALLGHHAAVGLKESDSVRRAISSEEPVVSTAIRTTSSRWAGSRM